MRYYAFVCIITPYFISSYINDNFKHPYKSESQNGHIINHRLFANKTEMKLGFKCILIFCRYKDTQKKNETPDDNTHDMCFYAFLRCSSAKVSGGYNVFGVS